MPARDVPQTEQLNQYAKDLDLCGDDVILSRLLASQQAALSAIESCIPHIARAANLMVETLDQGGRLHYAAAGSSGLMALADGAELPGTYGIDPGRISIHMAGGIPTGADMPGHTEDDERAGINAAADVSAADTVIAISASGTTPFPLSFVHQAKRKRARVVCIANNPEAPLFEQADIAICIPTPPELVAGSTRLGAATAQKAALNMMSTLMGVRMGHVVDGMMVNVVADNRKLLDRAEGIVARITGAPGDAARENLSKCKGNVKQAVLLAMGARSPDHARHLLASTNGQLRPAMQQLK